MTPRETTVLPLTVSAVGRRLDISVRTVHKHLENVYRKLGTHDCEGPCRERHLARRADSPRRLMSLTPAAQFTRRYIPDGLA
ncbi:LuxR C-terminal-related transcriptional regulator [Streptomyces coelicoflavus]|uniref:LuxR C-terminal-related transcriptional regulator n=1 Tax=Streptomyces coelicoflavus TaxID=285562 RepID=UPI00364DF166